MYGDNGFYGNQGAFGSQDPMQMGYGHRVRRPSKQEIIGWFKNYMGCEELDLVDDTYDQFAKHVCFGGGKIELLPKQVFNFQMPDGVVPLEYYICPKCRKIILNRNFI